MSFVKYHIGARDGTDEFPSTSAFADEIYSVLFEADSNSVESIKKTLKRNQEIHSFVVAGKDGPNDFYHNTCPYTSSILPAHQGPEDWTLFLNDHDYIIREALSPQRVESVYTRSLDSLRSKELLSSPPPDFISLDTQGSELDILRGGTATLDCSVVGCMVEVEFHPLYKNQPLFGEISRFMSERGFWFVGFNQILDLAPYRYPIGLRGKGFNLTGNALFIKSPICAVQQNPQMLPALAFCAIIFDCLEIAWKCFDQKEYKTNENAEKKGSINLFLHQMREAYLAHPSDYPLTSEEYKEKQSAIHNKRISPSTEIENILRSYRLESQADIVRKNWQKYHLISKDGH